MTSDLTVVVATLAIYAAVVISPGPNFALVSRLALSGARPAAFGAAFGFAIAATVYALLTMAGLAVLLERVGWLATAVQIAGGCYLVYLGLGAWRSTPGNAPVEGVDPARGPLYGLRAGLLVNLSNPKAIAFFVGLYAVAVPPGTALWAKAAIIAGSFATEVVWYGLVATLLSTARARAAYGRFAKVIDRAIGSVLAAFGLRLIWEKV